LRDHIEARLVQPLLDVQTLLRKLPGRPQAKPERIHLPLPSLPPMPQSNQHARRDRGVQFSADSISNVEEPEISDELMIKTTRYQ
jgi:hypothetical protein